MARRRGPQRGYLYEENGLWKLRWWEDSIDKHGSMKWKRSTPYILGRPSGVGKLTKKQAQRLVSEKMSEVNRLQFLGPRASMTISEFIDSRFVPDRSPELTANGQRHYRAVLKVVREAFGDWQLLNVARSDVAAWLLAQAGAGKSHEWVKKLRNGLHALYEHAADCGMCSQRNPAHKLKIPRIARLPQKTQPYTIDDLKAILRELDSPLWEMAVLGSLTSLGGAELAGLCINHLNLSDEARFIKDRTVPSWSLYSCEAWTNGRRTEGKTNLRRRVLPIPQMLRLRLVNLAGERPADEPLFVMPRTRKTMKQPRPVDTGNIASRRFRPLSKNLGFRITWHRFRATNATLVDQMLLDDETRKGMMGHWSKRMTDHYVDPVERQRHAADAIADVLFGEPPGRVN